MAGSAYPARMTEVAALEDVCERAWPPRERIELDGAVLRFTHGFTRRANSARVDGGGERSRRPDRAGRARVPQPRAATRVPADAALPAGVRAPAARARLRRRHRGRRDGGRRAAASRRRGGRRRDRARCRARRGMAARLPGRRAPLAVRAGPGRPLGARLGRLAAPLRARPRRRRARGRPGTPAWRTTGSTSPASARFPGHRRRGLARAVSERLFAWGARSGARRAILQVETKNAAAQGLYAQLGFRPRYVYRDLVPGSAATD